MTFIYSSYNSRDIVKLYVKLLTSRFSKHWFFGWFIWFGPHTMNVDVINMSDAHPSLIRSCLYILLY